MSKTSKRLFIGMLILLLPLLFGSISKAAEEDELLGDEDLELLDEVEEIPDAGDDAVDGADAVVDEAEPADDGLQDVVGGESDELKQELELLKGAEDEAEEALEGEDDEALKLLEENESDINIKMIFIEGGCFMMGDTFGDGHKDERPAHEVCVDDFSLAETEMTQQQLEQIMGFNTARWTLGPEYPAEYFNWFDANHFMNKLNEKTKRFYRFPSEAEWEYAARERGKKIRWAGTNDELELDQYAWFDDNAGGQIQPVKTKKPNALGLYDMNGNVWEWIYDYYDMNYYQQKVRDNPEGPDFAIWRGLRGGSYGDDADKLRNSARYGRVPHIRRVDVGLRLAE